MRSAGMFCRFTFPRAMFQGCICAALRIQWHPPKNANAHAGLARAIEIQPPWDRPVAATPSARASSTASPADGTTSPARSSAPSWAPSPSSSTGAKTTRPRMSKSRLATRENSANGQQLNLDQQAPSTVPETCDLWFFLSSPRFLHRTALNTISQCCLFNLSIQNYLIQHKTAALQPFPSDERSH